MMTNGAFRGKEEISVCFKASGGPLSHSSTRKVSVWEQLAFTCLDLCRAAKRFPSGGKHFKFSHDNKSMGLIWGSEVETIAALEFSRVRAVARPRPFLITVAMALEFCPPHVN